MKVQNLKDVLVEMDNDLNSISNKNPEKQAKSAITTIVNNYIISHEGNKFDNTGLINIEKFEKNEHLNLIKFIYKSKLNFSDNAIKINYNLQLAFLVLKNIKYFIKITINRFF